MHAATELLSEAGLEGFRVVDVAARACANVALINYHFGGRDGLLDEVIRNVAAGVGLERDRRLRALIQACAPRLPTVEEVVRCWIEPMVAAIATPRGLGPFRTMIHLMFVADVPEARKATQLTAVLEVTARFLDVLEEILPSLGRPTLTWRMLCAIGSCYLVLGQAEPFGWSALAGGHTTREAMRRAAVESLVSFVVAGIAAPLANSADSPVARSGRKR